MLGFLIGTVCLIGLFKVLRHGHGFGHGCGWRSGYGHGGFDDEGPGWRRGFGGPPWRGRGGSGLLLRGLFERLDTSPGQEKVIREAIDELRDAGSKLRDEARNARGEIARIMRGPAVDETLLGELFARHDTAIESLRKTAVGSLAKVHDALDEKQRSRLADLIESGPFRGRWGGGRRWGGPYREAY